MLHMLTMFNLSVITCVSPIINLISNLGYLILIVPIVIIVINFMLAKLDVQLARNSAEIYYDMLF